MRIIRILLVCILLNCCESLWAQSILDTLSRPAQSADTELLTQANQVAVEQANAAAKRASLLTRRANELRSQLDQLEKQLEAERSEHAALKTSVSEFHRLFLSLAAMFENQELANLPNQIDKMRVLSEKTLLPKLAKKQTPESQDKSDKVEPTATPDAPHEKIVPDSPVVPRTDPAKKDEPPVPTTPNGTDQ